MGVAEILVFLVPLAVGKTGASFDKKAEVLTASAAAAADLRAPTAQVARVRAEHQARTRAEKKLMAALAELGDARDEDELAETAAAARVDDVRYGSDGSVELTLSLSTAELGLAEKTIHKRSHGNRSRPK